jgi:hypothetical protein
MKPRIPDDLDTDQLVLNVLAEGQPRDQIELLAGRLAAKTGGNGLFGIAKFVAALLVAAATAYFGMRVAISDNTGAIRALQRELDIHAHPKIDERLRTVERQTDRIETKQEAVLKGIGEIKSELRDDRRRQRDR